jgi:hypothetical protein
MAYHADASGSSNQVLADGKTIGGATGDAQAMVVLDATPGSTSQMLVGSNGAAAVMLAADGLVSGGVLRAPGFFNAQVPVNQTGYATNLPAGVASRQIAVTSLFVMVGATGTTITFTSSGGSTIAGPFSPNPAGGFVLPFNPHGWFRTVAGEGLTVTTSATGSTVAVLGSYAAV